MKGITPILNDLERDLVLASSSNEVKEIYANFVKNLK